MKKNSLMRRGFNYHLHPWRQRPRNPIRVVRDDDVLEFTGGLFEDHKVLIFTDRFGEWRGKLYRASGKLRASTRGADARQILVSFAANLGRWFEGDPLAKEGEQQTLL